MKKALAENIYHRAKKVLSSQGFETLGKMTQVPVTAYSSEAQYQDEFEKIFKKFPIPLLPLQTLPQSGDFATRTLWGTPLLILRDENLKLQVFINTCRHRGAKLVDEVQGQCRAIKCPYHGWTYNLQGELQIIPEQKTGFAQVEKGSYGLKSFKTLEKAGFLWISFNGDFSSLDAFGDEIDALELNDYQVYDARIQLGQFNWKISANAFLEGYHFNFAHAKTALNYYIHNRFLLDGEGMNQRVIIFKKTLQDQIQRSDFVFSEIGSHITMLYHLFPFCFLFFLGDHAFYINMIPESLSSTRMELYVFFPHGPRSEKETKYFDLNRDISQNITQEDLLICEGIQEGLHSGANQFWTLGTFEMGVAKFQQHLAELLK